MRLTKKKKEKEKEKRYFAYLFTLQKSNLLVNARKSLMNYGLCVQKRVKFSALGTLSLTIALRRETLGA